MKKPARKNRYASKSEAPKTRIPVKKWLPAIFRVVAGVVILAVMSLVCIFSYDWVTQCDYFRADEIVVIGYERLDPEKIKKISGIGEGVNIFSVNLAVARKHLLAEPWIREAGIRRDFPSKIEIRIHEHKALAVIDFGRPFLIDIHGNIFKAYEDEDSGMPMVSGVAYREWTAGNDQETAVFQAVMKILQLGSKENSIMPNSNIERVIVDKEIGLSLQIREPALRVALGFGDYEKKIGRFAQIFDHLARTELNHEFVLVDIQNPDRIVARPVSENQVVAGKGGSSEGT